MHTAPMMGETLDTLMTEYPDDISVIYYHSPLGGIESEGGSAALASMCANEQGKFWEYHDAIFLADDLSEYTISATAANIVSDIEQFKHCYNTKKYYDGVLADIHEGERLELYTSPVVYINGIKISGAQHAEHYIEIIKSLKAENSI